MNPPYIFQIELEPNAGQPFEEQQKLFNINKKHKHEHRRFVSLNLIFVSVVSYYYLKLPTDCNVPKYSSNNIFIE
jgi:hypothetical protein